MLPNTLGISFVVQQDIIVLLVKNKRRLPTNCPLVSCNGTLANLPINAFVYSRSAYRKKRIFVKRFGRKSKKKGGGKESGI
jgi:hypothetical protein